MGLKPFRSRDVDYTLDCFMDEVAERGGMASYSTVGSGEAMDSALQLATYAANGSGKVPAGLLIQDMVNLDLTLYHLNWHQSQVQKGGKVSLVRKGEFQTNSIEGSWTAPGPLYMGHSGLFTTVYTNDAATPKVGKATSKLDEDGYGRVFINLT
jgi:hypothetical protein